MIPEKLTHRSGQQASQCLCTDARWTSTRRAYRRTTAEGQPKNTVHPTLSIGQGVENVIMSHTHTRTPV